MDTDASVIITDAAGRQVFGLTASFTAALDKRGTPAQFGEFFVRVRVDPPPPWWINLPGAIAYAYVRNRARLHYTNIRNRLRARAILRRRVNPFYAETTSADD